jgi:hypothetical protein
MLCGMFQKLNAPLQGIGSRNRLGRAKMKPYLPMNHGESES